MEYTEEEALDRMRKTKMNDFLIKLLSEVTEFDDFDLVCPNSIKVFDTSVELDISVCYDDMGFRFMFYDEPLEVVTLLLNPYLDPDFFVEIILEQAQFYLDANIFSDTDMMWN